MVYRPVMALQLIVPKMRDSNEKVALLTLTVSVGVARGWVNVSLTQNFVYKLSHSHHNETEHGYIS